MPHLAHADVDAVAELAGQLAELDTREAFPNYVLDRLAELVPADCISYCELDRVAERVLFETEWPPQSVAFDPADFWRLRAQDPACTYQDRTLDFRARTMSDFMGLRELRRTEYYSVFLAPNKTRYRLDVGLPARLNHTKVFLFDRQDRDFSARDRTLLDVLRPHLAARYQAARRTHAEREMTECLTPREREVLALVHAGMRNGEIAAELSIAPGTVRKHLDNVYAKLGVSNRTAAAAKLPPSPLRAATHSTALPAQ